jgi:hypothetical protein
MSPICFIEKLNTPGFTFARKTGRKGSLTPDRQSNFLLIRQLHAGGH